jgi:hypothetical protein
MQPTHPSIDTTTHGTDNDARDSFRGMHLDPNAHHWDEVSIVSAIVFSPVPEIPG